MGAYIILQNNLLHICLKSCLISNRITTQWRKSFRSSAPYFLVQKSLYKLTIKISSLPILLSTACTAYIDSWKIMVSPFSVTLEGKTPLPIPSQSSHGKTCCQFQKGRMCLVSSVTPQKVAYM